MSDEKIINEKEKFREPAKRTCTVSFNACVNGLSENIIPPITVVSGGIFRRPPDPEKKDCRFAGWYADRELVKAYDFQLPVLADIVLYAKWVFVQEYHDMYFYYPDGDFIKSVPHGQPMKRPPDPEKKGYEFLGWYYCDVPEEAYYYLFDTPVTESISLWGDWKEQTRSKLDPNGAPTRG